VFIGQHGGLPLKNEEGKAPIGDKTREEILKEVEERIRTMVKVPLEVLIKEERDICLENHPTKANVYYTTPATSSPS